MKCSHISIFALGVLAAASAPAQMVVSSRLSTLSYSYVHGGAGDSHVDDQTMTYNSLLLTDTQSFTVHSETSGSLGSNNWATSVDGSAAQDYTIAGSLANASGISGNLTNSLAAAGSGTIPTAVMRSINPGNETVIYFSVGQDRAFNLSGTRSHSSGARVALQRFDSIVWQYVFNSDFLPSGDTSFSTSGTLLAGSDYRLVANVDGIANMNQSLARSATYNMTAVPEPATMAVLGLGALGLLKRRRKA